MFKRKQKELTPEQQEVIRTKDFFDCIAPATIKFFSDYYIVGNSYRCVWAIKEYPPATEEQAIFAQLADRSGVTLRIYSRPVDALEQRQILQHAERKNKLKLSGNNLQDSVEAESNLRDLTDMLANRKQNREILVHCAVFIELRARSMDALKELKSEVEMELTRSKLLVEKLGLRQKEAFKSVMPMGSNQFGAQFERVLPVSSEANMFPFNFSGRSRTDPFYRRS